MLSTGLLDRCALDLILLAILRAAVCVFLAALGLAVAAAAGPEAAAAEEGSGILVPTTASPCLFFGERSGPAGPVTDEAGTEAASAAAGPVLMVSAAVACAVAATLSPPLTAPPEPPAAKRRASNSPTEGAAALIGWESSCGSELLADLLTCAEAAEE